jgi:hypothetical protein
MIQTETDGVRDGQTGRERRNIQKQKGESEIERNIQIEKERMRQTETNRERANVTDRDRWGVRKREKFALGENGQNQALCVRAPSLHFSRPSAAVQSRRALLT